MKKIISMLTAVLMLVTLFAVPANATSYARVELNAAEYHVGDTVIATVYLDLDEKVTSFGVDYPFDENVLTFVEDDSSWNEDANSIMETIVDLKGNYKAAWTASKGTNFSTLSGGALTLVFTVNKLAPGGETTINFNVVLKNNGVNEVVPVTIKTACANHTYGDWAKEDDDNHKRVCTTENCTGFETAPHNWDSGVVTTDPTCCDKGVKTFTCADCKATKTEDVDPTGEHVYGDWVDNGDGTHTKTCTGSTCRDFVTADHVWDAGVVTTEPSCNEKGVKTFTCECGATYTEDIDPTGEHTYGSWVDNGDGTHTHTCTGTGCTASETKDHVWGEGEVTTDPTCCDKGVRTYTCGCGATYTEDIDPTGEHTYGAWTSADDNNHVRNCTGTNCTESETKAHDWANACDDTCDTCGHTRTITHDYATEWSSNASQHWHECNVCGNKTDIASHDHDSNNVCACGHIKPANQFVSGYIYVNKDYHMIIMTNGVLTSGHVVDANGDCILCLGHIVDDEIVVEVEDPIEPSTDEEEVVEAPEVDETPEVEENPKTGIAFGLVALAASACAVLLSKKR